MITTAKWIERQFVFDMPLWMFPNILERLRGTPARLEEMVASLPENILTIKPDGKWSVLEQVAHLWRVEELFLGRLDDYDAKLSELRPAYFADDRAAMANFSEKPKPDILRGFRKARMDLVARLEVMDDAAILRTAMHPRLNKPMRVLDLMFFSAEHDDHHLAKITELKLALTDSGRVAKT